MYEAVPDQNRHLQVLDTLVLGMRVLDTVVVAPPAVVLLVAVDPLEVGVDRVGVAVEVVVVVP